MSRCVSAFWHFSKAVQGSHLPMKLQFLRQVGYSCGALHARLPDAKGLKYRKAIKGSDPLTQCCWE